MTPCKLFFGKLYSALVRGRLLTCLISPLRSLQEYRAGAASLMHKPAPKLRKTSLPIVKYAKVSKAAIAVAPQSLKAEPLLLNHKSERKSTN